MCSALVKSREELSECTQKRMETVRTIMVVAFYLYARTKLGTTITAVVVFIHSMGMWVM